MDVKTQTDNISFCLVGNSKKKIKLFKVITILVSNNNKSPQQIKNKQKMPREQASAAMHGNVFKQIRNTTVIQMLRTAHAE